MIQMNESNKLTSKQLVIPAKAGIQVLTQILRLGRHPGKLLDGITNENPTADFHDPGQKLAGMTAQKSFQMLVSNVQSTEKFRLNLLLKIRFEDWIPAFAGMTACKKVIGRLILVGLMLLGGAGMRSVCADNSDPRVRVLLEEALRLYSERQYVRALDLFKQVQRIDPANATANEYVKSSEQRIMEWESKDEGSNTKRDANWDTLLNKKKSTGPETFTNANDIIAARKSLVERMRNRSTNTDNIVQIQDTKKGLEIVLFHDQLFLPGLQTLRDEALPILENVSQLIRQKGDRPVTVTSQAHTNSNDPFLLFPKAENSAYDPSLPNMKSGGTSMLFQDTEAIRSIILFTYLAQRSMGLPAKTYYE